MLLYIITCYDPDHSSYEFYYDLRSVILLFKLVQELDISMMVLKTFQSLYIYRVNIVDVNLRFHTTGVEWNPRVT